MPRLRTNIQIQDNFYTKVLHFHQQKTIRSVENIRTLANKGLIKTKEFKTIKV